MNKFNEVYFRLFFESVGNIPFNLKQFKKFLDYSIKFKNGNIISEDKNLLIDVTSDLFNYCIENQGEIISFTKIKKLMKKSKHYQNIKNSKGKDLIFNIFDFDDESEVKNFIFKTFKLDINNDLFLDAYNHFNNVCKNIDGFFNFYNEIGICIINANSSDIQSTIYHELSHYIQKTANIRIINDFTFNKEKLEDNEKFKQLNVLGVKYEDLNYYFSKFEFIPHVNDLISGLWKTFQMFYINNADNIDPMLTFLISLNTEIINNKNFSKSIFLQKYSLANNGNIAPLIMYVASYYFNHKYQKITNYIKTGLNKKFYKN